MISLLIRSCTSQRADQCSVTGKSADPWTEFKSRKHIPKKALTEREERIIFLTGGGLLKTSESSSAWKIIPGRREARQRYATPHLRGSAERLCARLCDLRAPGEMSRADLKHTPQWQRGATRLCYDTGPEHRPKHQAEMQTGKYHQITFGFRNYGN